MPGWWRYARALLITCALVFGLIAGLPEAGGRLQARLSPRTLAFVRRIPALREQLLRPVAPLAGAFGIQSQNWSLFSASGGTRHRLWIETRTHDGPWTLAFRAHDDQHTELQHTLEYRRVFNIWKPYYWGISRAYPALVQWVARRLCSEHPEIDEVRASQEQVEIKGAGQGFVSTGRFDYVVSVMRAEVLPR